MSKVHETINSKQTGEERSLEMIKYLLKGVAPSEIFGIPSSSIEDCLMAAEEQAEKGDHETALLIAMFVAFLDSENVDAWVIAGRSAFIDKRYDVSQEAFLHAIYLNGETAYLNYSWGMSVYALGALEDAYKSIIRAEELLEPADRNTSLEKAILSAKSTLKQQLSL